MKDGTAWHNADIDATPFTSGAKRTLELSARPPGKGDLLV